MSSTLGHTFRCKMSWQQHGTSIRIARGEVGFITYASGNTVHVTIISRPTRVIVQHVPIANLELGPLYIAETADVPVELRGFDTIAISSRPPGTSSYRNDTDPFRRATAAFLSGVWANRARLPYFSQHHQAWLGTDDLTKSTTQRFRDNVKRVNPQFFTTLGNAQSTLESFKAILSRTSADSRSAGVYLGLMSDFRIGTSRYGLPTHAYIGQSNNIGRRIKEHTQAADSNRTGQEVHQTMRDARSIRWYKLAQHEVDEGGSDRAGTAMRDIMETTFMMIFSTMSHRVIAPSARNTPTLSSDISLDFDDQSMAQMCTSIAKQAFGKEGITLPRSPQFGLHRYGCNYTISLGGEGRELYERTVWSRKDDSTCWSFHRPPLTLQKEKRVHTLSYRDHGSTTLTLVIQPTAQELKDMSIAVNDQYFAVWEVQKDGQHPVPFFRLCEIGPWSNWSYANKVAFKIVWKSSRGKEAGIWKTKYMQRQARPRFVDNCVAPGSLLDYSLGVGVYSFFTRTRFPRAQRWSADFGQAVIVTATVDNFAQRITVAPAPLVLHERLTGPVLHLGVPRVRMERLGLQNVNGPWQSLNFDWLSDPSLWKDGIIPEPKSLRGFKGRKKCDYCYLTVRSSLAGVHAGTMECKRVGNSNICEDCNKMGRPCSWTGLPYLFGPGWQDDDTGRKTGRGELHAAAVKGLLCYPYSAGALQVHVVGNDGDLTEMDDNVSHSAPIQWSELTSAEQATFNRWDADVRRIITFTEGQTMGSQQYEAGMLELSRLADAVRPGVLTPNVFRYMRRIVVRDLFHFMIDGYTPVRGG